MIFFIFLTYLDHSLSSPFFFRKMTVVTKITAIPGMRVIKKKLSGSLHARDATMIEDDTAINANPIVVNRLAHLLWIRAKTDDKEKGKRSIPTAMTTAIWDSCGSKLNPNEHFLSAMLKTEEADDSEAIAKKMNIAPITLALTSKRE
jgi:hypothetical protein